MKTYDKMTNRDAHALWVESLRSGEYRQADGNLRAKHPDGTVRYCCLGVLCDLGDKSSQKWTDKLQPWSDPRGIITYRYAGEICTKPERDYGWDNGGFPPVEVLEGAGLDQDAGIHLANMNDEGASFAEIADFIEKNL